MQQRRPAAAAAADEHGNPRRRRIERRGHATCQSWSGGQHSRSSRIGIRKSFPLGRRDGLGVAGVGMAHDANPRIAGQHALEFFVGIGRARRRR